jgi:hypothetical protein
MTEGSDNLLAILSKKIDDQARFTRGVNIICTLAIIAVVFYSLTSLVSVLPGLVLAEFMGNLEQVQTQWKLIENVRAPKSHLPPAAPKDIK